MVFRLVIVVFAAACLFGAARAEEASDFTTLRNHMVDAVQAWTRFTREDTGVAEIDPRVLSAMREVPRHLFVPEAFRSYAYNSHPLPLGYEQNIASPFLVALMTHLVQPEAGDVVFETGTGAGYHAALLARLVAEVYSVDVVAPLVERAAETLERLDVDNAHARAGDGYYGWAAHAPFDAIIVKEAVDHVPVPLLNQLKPGGRMVIPLSVGGDAQYLTVVVKAAEGRLQKTRVLPVRFSPLQGGDRT